jgi:two-component sensor histidine kinase
MRILRFTPVVMQIINLIKSDMGRPVGHIVSNLLGYNSLVEDIQHVLDTLVPRELEVQTKDEKWYAMHILPYRTLDNVIEGAVITFVDINERKLADDKIKTLLAEKEIILQEVHHRVKNNLNTISALLCFQGEGLEDPAISTVLKEVSQRVQSMGVIYNKLYQSPNYNDLSIKEYLSALTDQIISNFPNADSINVEKHIDDFIVKSKKLQPIGLIVNELLTNIMKYAFIGRSDRAISISAELKDGKGIISIYDNGVGMPVSVDFESSTGFGLKLIKLLSMQINGKIRIERENGTKVILEFGM